MVSAALTARVLRLRSSVVVSSPSPRNSHANRPMRLHEIGRLPRARSEGNIEFLAELLVELLVELFGELLLSLGWESLVATWQPKSKVHPALAYCGYVIAGTLIGTVSTLVVPRRFSSHIELSLLGVCMNALALGLTMHRYGARRSRAGNVTTHLASFWGGAAFAFAISAARLAVLMR